MKSPKSSVGLDLKDWRGLEALLAERVEVDYSDLGSGPSGGPPLAIELLWCDHTERVCEWGRM